VGGRHGPVARERGHLADVSRDRVHEPFRFGRPLRFEGRSLRTAGHRTSRSGRGRRSLFEPPRGHDGHEKDEEEECAPGHGPTLYTRLSPRLSMPVSALSSVVGLRRCRYGRLTTARPPSVIATSRLTPPSTSKL